MQDIQIMNAKWAEEVINIIDWQNEASYNNSDQVENGEAQTEENVVGTRCGRVILKHDRHML